MINKKISLVIYFIIFIVSAFLANSFFNQGGSMGFLPQTKYKPPENNQNGTKISNGGSVTEAKTEECPLNGTLYGKTSRQKW